MSLRKAIMDRVRSETDLLRPIEFRDLPKRIAMASIFLALMVYLGMTTAALVTGILIILIETTVLILTRKEIAAETELPFAQVALHWVVNFFSAIVYMVPGVKLAGHRDHQHCLDAWCVHTHRQRVREIAALHMCPDDPVHDWLRCCDLAGFVQSHPACRALRMGTDCRDNGPLWLQHYGKPDQANPR